MKKITLKEIAQLAGVSVMTVSNVIRENDSKVSLETKEKIQSLVKKYNYVPNQNASNLRTGKSSLIGVLFYSNRKNSTTDFTDPFISSIVTGVSSAARENGYFTMIHSVQSPESVVTLQMNWKFAGFVVIGLPSDDFYKIDSVIQTPVSYIDTYWQEDKPLKKKPRNFIETNEKMISRNVASFINELHHENVLFYSFDFDKSKPSVIQKRYLGFKEKFQGNIFERSTSSADYQSILQSVKDYLSAQPFTLIYTTADILAVKLNQIFKDISVIGIDNAEFTDFVTPKLTTVAIDQVKKGEVAIERLLESIESGTSAYYELESQLIIRDSAWINQAE